MSKSSSLNHKILDKSKVAMFCIIGMFAGFLVSRVVLSISMFLFGINAIRDVPVRQWFKQKWWLLGLSWVAMYALSGLWSQNTGDWSNHLQTKLPFLLLPLAFSYQPRFSQQQIKVLTISLGVMLMGAAFYSVSFFLIDPEFYTHEYHVSHMLPTLPKRDHIRCSLSMTLFIIWCVYSWQQLQGRGLRWFVGICIAVLFIYLHILAAKTGLVSLYIFIVFWGVYMAIARRKLAGLLIIAAIPLFVILAVNVMPTLRERVNFLDYSYFMLKRGDKSGNIGDIARIISYRLAIDIIKENPLLGTGAGDMKQEMDKKYAEQYPQIPEHGRLLPHNQVLTVGLGCGIPAMLLFLAWVFAPLTRLRRNRESFFFFMVWLLLFLQLMIEPVLEVQYGVFIYLYFLLLQMQPLRKENAIQSGT